MNRRTDIRQTRQMTLKKQAAEWAFQRNLEARNPGNLHGCSFPSWIPGFQIPFTDWTQTLIDRGFEAQETHRLHEMEKDNLFYGIIYLFSFRVISCVSWAIRSLRDALRTKRKRSGSRTAGAFRNLFGRV
jgi:hypothetical protein